MVKFGDLINRAAGRGKEPEEFLPRKKKKGLSAKELKEIKRKRAEGRKWVLVLVVVTAIASFSFWILGQREGGLSGMISPIGESLQEISEEGLGKRQIET